MKSEGAGRDGESVWLEIAESILHRVWLKVAELMLCCEGRSLPEDKPETP